MKKKIVIYFFCCFQLPLSAQELFLKTGKNFTEFKFIKADGTESIGLQKGVGDVIKVGYNYAFIEKVPLAIEACLTLNEYNALVGFNSYYISWETCYVGLQSDLVYYFLNQEEYAVGVRVGGNVSKIVYGKEQINNIVYDIKKTDNFKSFLFQYLVGLDAKYIISDYVAIGVSYNLINSLNASQSASNKFFINNNQISAGIYFNIGELTDDK